MQQRYSAIVFVARLLLVRAALLSLLPFKAARAHARCCYRSCGMLPKRSGHLYATTSVSLQRTVAVCVVSACRRPAGSPRPDAPRQSMGPSCAHVGPTPPAVPPCPPLRVGKTLVFTLPMLLIALQVGKAGEQVFGLQGCVSRLANVHATGILALPPLFTYGYYSSFLCRSVLTACARWRPYRRITTALSTPDPDCVRYEWHIITWNPPPLPVLLPLHPRRRCVCRWARTRAP